MHLFSNVNDFGSNICCGFVEVKNFELIYHPIRKKANFIEWLESAEWLGSAGPVEVSKYGVMCALQSHFSFPSENRFPRRLRVSTLRKHLARLRSSVQVERRVKKKKKQWYPLYINSCYDVTGRNHLSTPGKNGFFSALEEYLEFHL